MIRRKRLTHLVQRLIQTDSVNPPGNEAALARFIEQEMLALGLEVNTYAFASNRPNVVATLKAACPPENQKVPSLLITPHIDTVPFGQGWRYDPLGGKIVKGRIYGRGATDDKGNLACGMEVMRSLVEDRAALSHDVTMAATVDEETGSHLGMIPLLQKKIVDPDAAVILDADECDAVIVQKGLLHCRVQILGKKAHGAYPWKGSNAIETAVKVIGRIKAHRFVHKTHPLLRGPTTNVGVIQGGDKVNMVADFCEFALDVRFLPGTKSRDLIRQIHTLIRSQTKKYRMEIDSCQEPFEISRAHPLVKSYLTTARRMRLSAKAKGSEGATVMTFFRDAGVPAFATGYGARGTAHTTDEYAHIDTLYQGSRLLEQFIKHVGRC